MNELKNWDNYSSAEEEEPPKKENNKVEKEDKSNSTYNNKDAEYLNRYLPLIENTFDVIIFLNF